MSKKKAYQPTTMELNGAFNEFGYELQMFRNSVEIFLGLPAPRDPNLHNVCLEAALLHIRNLLDFFCGDPTPNDDMRAAHFLPSTALPRDQTWWSSKKLPIIGSKREEINKSLNHLTYTRVRKKPFWDLAKFREEIEEAYKEFRSLLPEKEHMLWPA